MPFPNGQLGGGPEPGKKINLHIPVGSAGLPGADFGYPR
jgi:hypothetical protein